VTLRILLADDHAMFRFGQRAVLDTQPDFECVAEVADGPAAVSETTRLRPDVAILDVRMPKLDGLAAAKATLAEGHVGTRVLVLTTFDADEYVYRAERHDGRAGARARSLTARENEVLLLVAAGYSNVEIGGHLYVGDEPVKTHVSRILAKFDLRDRVHAVVYAHRHGLLRP
jgi:DNA-binding NarL/FixJ family response regulator